jgi:hypothetical protein
VNKTPKYLENATTNESKRRKNTQACAHLKEGTRKYRQVRPDASEEIHYLQVGKSWEEAKAGTGLAVTDKGWYFWEEAFSYISDSQKSNSFIPVCLYFHIIFMYLK